MAKKRANLYSKYLPLIAQFCTELAGKKKEPDYKKMLKEEIEIPIAQEKQEVQEEIAIPIVQEKQEVQEEPIVAKNPKKEEEIVIEKVQEKK